MPDLGAASAQNVNTIRALFKTIEEGRLEAIATEFAAPNFVRHDLADIAPDVRGPAGARAFLDDLKRALPDLQLIIEDIFGAEDKVVVRFVVEGTRLGIILGGGAPTSRRVRFNNINIYRFEAGRVAETWQLADALGLMAQLSQWRTADSRRANWGDFGGAIHGSTQT